MPPRLSALALVAVVVAAAGTANADQVPQFDARPGCLAGAVSGLSARPDVDACVRKELEARDQIAGQWEKFAADDRERCVSKTRTGGPPSYIEVLTCLEIARDVKRLRIENRDNTGLSTGARR